MDSTTTLHRINAERRVNVHSGRKASEVMMEPVMGHK